MEEVSLYRKEFFNHPVILVDGITRTGKSMLGPLLASFKGVELERLGTLLEHIIILHGLNKLKRDAAVTLLRLEVQTAIYENMLSRNTNFRLSDHTGVFNQAYPLRYIRRLFMKDGDPAFERIKKEEPAFQVMQHDVMGGIDLYFEAFGERLRVLEIVRHPIDVIHSQYVRKYGQREDNDPRHFSFTIQYKEKLLPWFCYGWEDEYLYCKTPMERVIKVYKSVFNRLWNGYKRLTPEQKKQVLLIPFEKIVTDPWSYVSKIENFIGREHTRRTKWALKKGRCPRILKNEEKKRKIEDIKKFAGEEYLTIVETLSKEYEEIIRDL